MQYLRRNPFIIWTKWWLRTRKTLKENEGKHLKIGHLSYLTDTSLGIYDTIYDKVVLKNSSLGDFVYIQDDSIITNTTFGNFCSVGPRVRIGPGMHPVEFISTHPVFYSTRLQCQTTFTDKDYFDESGTVKIGNDVWIGAGAMIMDNINIGDGAIIAAGAVVSKDVEPYVIVGGVPAVPIKKRFSDENIDKLLRSKWWSKDIEWLKQNYLLFNNPDNFFNATETNAF